LILAGEVLASATPFLERKIHPIVIIAAFKKALEDSLDILRQVSVPVDIQQKAEMMKLIRSSIGTKMVNAWGDLMCNLAYEAVKTVAVEKNGKKEIDIKRYARVEKV
jgi:T-complex protein 1 subunit gamma